MKHVSLWLAAAAGLVFVGALRADGGLTSTTTATCIDNPQEIYAEGFNAGNSQGYTNGYSQGFNNGYSQGSADGTAFCFENPALCSITLQSCLPPPQFGETEPNDNLVTADGLPFDVQFWGQSYGPADQDWFYIVTTKPNQNLTVSFSIANGPIEGWKVSILDSAGNLFADFDTGTAGSVAAPEDGVAYRVTLGLVGTYYILVEPVAGTVNYSTYNIAALLQDSPLDGPNYVVGFYDVELEPNNVPGQSTWLTEGVTMYGVVNLSFENTVPAGDGSTREWAQGADWDWYAYYSSGSELITLTICGREKCEPGNWFIEVYDYDGANMVASGGTANALLAINTDTTSESAPLTYKLGLPKSEIYYLRVNHKRLFSAPCLAYALDVDNNGIVDGQTGSCSCGSGDSCNEIKSVVTAASCLQTEVPAADPADPPTSSATYFCPDGSAGTQVGGDASSTVTCAVDVPVQCETACRCVAWGGVVELPVDAVTSEYNFTWNATHLPPGTYATDAYQDFQSRPSPYN
jgi:hypothetical protein